MCPYRSGAERGEVAPSYGGGGVMGRSLVAHDPSVADRILSHEVRKYRRATSPFEWGGTQDMSVPDDRAYRSRKPKRASIRQPWLSRQTSSSSAGLRGSRVACRSASRCRPWRSCWSKHLLALALLARGDDLARHSRRVEPAHWFFRTSLISRMRAPRRRRRNSSPGIQLLSPDPRSVRTPRHSKGCPPTPRQRKTGRTLARPFPECRRRRLTA